MNSGWGSGAPLPSSPWLRAGHATRWGAWSLLGEAVVERGAQQVVEQQDSPAPQFQPLPPGQALPVTQEAQTGARRGHN